MSARAINAKTQRGRGAEPIKAVSQIAFGYQLDKKVLERVWMERMRQKELLRAGKIKFDCASPVVNNDRKLRVLTEELGEVARAVDLLENMPSARIPQGASAYRKALEHLRDELTQNAAVTMAWLEALEVEGKP